MGSATAEEGTECPQPKAEPLSTTVPVSLIAAHQFRARLTDEDCCWIQYPRALCALENTLCHSVDYIKLFQHSPIGVGVTPILNTLKYRENPPKPVTTGNRETVRITKTHKNPTKQEMGKMILKTRYEKPVNSERKDQENSS